MGRGRSDSPNIGGRQAVEEMYVEIFTWMVAHRRDPAFLADLCGMCLDRLTDVACGKVVPTDEEWAAVAAATGVPETQLRSAVDPLHAPDHDPLQCYSIKKTAEILEVGRDRVDDLVQTGELASITLGERTIRIPRWAIDEMQNRLAGRGRVKGKGSCTAEPRDPPPPPWDPPERHPDDPPTGRPRLL